MLRTVLLLFCCVITLSPNDEVMEWNASRQLTWEDFRGKPNRQTSAAAVTASGITFSYSVRTSDDVIVSFDANAEAHFYPDNSWYIPERCNDYILKHEQLHFDITELHVRIFRYRMLRLRVTQNVRQELDRLHKQINKELAEMQTAYDEQSDHSRNKDSQAQWNAYVAENLEKFKAFRSGQ
ncbi:MAG: DUF922 domain-containing protein [Psychroserpens sp.]|nr:DUF922 domain-containing protein [Psychroserpens sp.]